MLTLHPSDLKRNKCIYGLPLYVYNLWNSDIFRKKKKKKKREATSLNHDALWDNCGT